MPEKYSIKKNILSVRDKATVDFHVQQHDYFGTLSTIVELLNQNCVLENKTELKKILKNLKKDLLYLQKNFDIIKKTRS
jgi:hypothetical protein